MKSNYTNYLKDNFRRAREATQRVDSTIVARDRADILAIDDAAETLEKIFQAISREIKEVKASLKERLLHLRRRMHFHMDRGITSVKYIIEHDFIRGWDVMAERTLESATQGFMETVTSINDLAHRALTPDNNTRHILYWIAETELSRKLNQARRAQDNVTTAMDAYRTGKPILTYRTTIDRRYDLTYVPLELLQHSAKSRDTHFRALVGHLENYKSGILGLQNVIANVSFAQILNKSLLAEMSYKFVKGAKGYNYRKFMLEHKVIRDPQQLIDARIATFLKFNETLHRYHVELLLDFDSVEQVVHSASSKAWKHIREARNALKDYLHNKTTLKTTLSAKLNSVDVTDAIKSLQVTFQTLRSRSRNMNDDWTRFEHAYIDVWSNMLSESTTKNVYNKLKEDVDDMVKYSNKSEKYVRIFASMLRVSKASVRQLPPTRFYELLNADFPIKNVPNVTQDIHQYVSSKRQSTNVAALLLDKDNDFLQPFLRMQLSLANFVQGNKITTSFFR